MAKAESTTDDLRFRVETERLRALVIPVEAIIGADCAAAAEEMAPRLQDSQGYVPRLNALISGRVSAIGDEVAFRDGRILERDYIPIAVDSVRRGHLWLFRDVTESRHLAQLAKAAAVRDELRLVIDTIPGLVWSALTSGQVELFNQRWREYTGLSLADGENWGWDGVIHPEDLPELQACFSLALSAGSPAELEARLRRSDGQYRWFLLRAVPLLGKDGLPTRWYGQAFDIDDRKRSEEALQHAQAELSHVSRVTTLGELAASIAHEVNQPISAMVTDASACLNWLNAPQPDLGKVRESLLAIVNDGARAGDVLNRIRALLARSAVSHQSCPIDQLLQSAASLSRAQLARDGIQLELSLAASHAHVMGDAVELQQVVLNLLLNAGEAARGLAAERRRVSLQSHVEQRADSTWVTVSVRDSGVGVDETELDRVFSAFYTTKPDGLGMGLSISRSIIQRHGGRIWVSPNADHGATFAFSLPAEPPAA